MGYYNDEILSINNILTNMIIIYKKLSEENKENNKDIQEQLSDIYNMIISLRNCSLNIFDKCNKILIKH